MTCAASGGTPRYNSQGTSGRRVCPQNGLRRGGIELPGAGLAGHGAVDKAGDAAVLVEGPSSSSWSPSVPSRRTGIAA